MARMFNRFGGWWQLWMALAVMWTILVITSGWMNLPRAQHVPHEPRFLSKLSTEASSILHGTYADAKPVRGALVWTETPRVVRMWNDTRLAFPATTTDARAEFVASEYRQLLNVEADKHRWPYLLEMLAIWLAPAALLLVAAMAHVNGELFGIMFANERKDPRQGGTIASMMRCPPTPETPLLAARIAAGSDSQ